MSSGDRDNMDRHLREYAAISLKAILHLPKLSHHFNRISLARCFLYLGVLVHIEVGQSRASRRYGKRVKNRGECKLLPQLS